MSFKVRLYSGFSKRDNSTKLPSSTYDEYSCVLKDSSGILNPRIELDLGLTTSPASYNYAYIPTFGRYYFIEEWVFEDRLWVANMRVDVLATYKSNIGNSTLYILRSSHSFDGSVMDMLYPCSTGCTFNSSTINNPWDDDMCFIVGVISRYGNYGSICYYAISSTNLVTMCSNLMDNTVTQQNGFDFTDVSQALQLSLVDPLQYIKSCVAIPLPISDFSSIGYATNVYAFNWDAGVLGYKLYQAPYVVKTYNFTKLAHPNASVRGSYLNSSPYTYATLTFPPFGTFEIDTTVLCNASGLQCEIAIDPITGKAILETSANNMILNRVEAQLGVPISLSSVTRDYVGAASSILSSAGGAIAGGAFAGAGGAIIGGLSGIGNAVEAMMPRSSTIGTNGGFASLMGTPKLDFQYFYPVQDDLAHNGRPFCGVDQLSSQPGYLLIQDGDVSTSGTASEDKMIRDYLEGGFYYE